MPHKLLQNEREESQGTEGGTKGAGATHPPCQSSLCSSTRSIAHSAEDQSQGFTAAVRGKSGHGRVMLRSWLNLICIQFYIFVFWPLSLSYYVLGNQKYQF